MHWSLSALLLTSLHLVSAQDGEAQGLAVPCESSTAQPIPSSDLLAYAQAIGDSSAPLEAPDTPAQTTQAGNAAAAATQPTTTPAPSAALASAGAPSQVSGSAPASFTTLPFTNTAPNPLASLPPITPETNTTAGRFSLQLITSVSNPYSDGYTNGTAATALNSSNLLITQADTQATVNFSSSNPQPALGTFQLNDTCFQSWDGRVAYFSPSAAVKDSSTVESIASIPVFFGNWSCLTDEEKANALSCSLDPSNPTFWTGDPTTPRPLTCAGEVSGTPLTDMFICQQSGAGIAEGYEGTLMMGGGIPSGCVPVTLSAKGVGELAQDAVDGVADAVGDATAANTQAKMGIVHEVLGRRSHRRWEHNRF
ncbi:MAG: hypothetical protein Q9162_004364 [Coniocarpon cinnabarinum]